MAKDIRIGKVFLRHKKPKDNKPDREVVLYMSEKGSFYYKSRSGNKIYVREIGWTYKIVGRGKQLFRRVFSR